MSGVRQLGGLGSPPDGLWEIARSLIPADRVRPHGGGKQNTPDERLFAAIIYVLVSGCAWRALPPCFGVSKSTVHRRLMIWARAGVQGRLHEAVNAFSSLTTSCDSYRAPSAPSTGPSP